MECARAIGGGGGGSVLVAGRWSVVVTPRLSRLAKLGELGRALLGW